MFQNIKVDIAYYKTNTDFEMEFNLCGCCRMRLLTDKAPDKKTLVHSLARAVSRSRVIIIVGNLFGGDGIINIAAGATGSKLAKADNRTYGISSEEDVEIISGSTPLVTPEGYFGGCIIEKGPQTMILLTENKNVRKSVMKTLIHPYIEELCAIELKEKAAAATPETENLQEAEVEEPQELEISQEEETPDEEISQEAEAASENESSFELLTEDETDGEDGHYEDDIDLITDEDDYEDIEMQTPDSEGFATFDDDEMSVDSDILYDEKGITTRDFKRRNAEYYNSEETMEDLVTEDEEYERNSFLRGGFGLPILIIAILLLVILIILCYCIFYVPSTQGVSATAYVKETFDILFG